MNMRSLFSTILPNLYGFCYDWRAEYSPCIQQGGYIDTDGSELCDSPHFRNIDFTRSGSLLMPTGILYITVIEHLYYDNQ